LIFIQTKEYFNMRRFRLFAAVVMTALALVAISAATASAKNTDFLPGTGGTKINSASSTATIQVKGGGSIVCESSVGSGSLTSSTEGSLTVTFKRCRAFGLPVNGLGDATETITVRVKANGCEIAAGDPGLAFTIEPSTGVHLEIPSVKQLLVIVGTDVVLVEGKNTEKNVTFGLNTKQAGGVSEFTKCNGTSLILLSSLNEGVLSSQDGFQALTASLTFAATQELMF
jgi:hypothetical protein